MTRRWRWPPESSAPSSPTCVSRPSGSDSTHASRRARLSAPCSSSSVASGLARRRFSRIVESKTCASCPASANVLRTSSCRSAADVDAVDRDPARPRIEEAQEKVRDRRLPGAARADERHPAARARAGGRSRRAPASLPDGYAAVTPSRATVTCPRGGACRLDRIGHPRLAVGQLEHAPSGGERRGELARRARERRDGVERRQREERERGDEDAVERAGVVRGDCDGQHADRREAGHEHGQRVREPGDESVATAEAHELTVGRADARERVLLPAVGDELGCAAQELDELGRQLAPRRRLAPADASPQPSCEHRHRDPAEREAEREDDGGHREARTRRRRHRRPTRRDRRTTARDRGDRAPGAHPRRRPVGSRDRRGETRPAPPAPAARCARTRSPGSARGRAARGRATRGGRGSARAAARGRGSGRRR